MDIFYSFLDEFIFTLMILTPYVGQELNYDFFVK